jgi:hypothetical protein
LVLAVKYKLNYGKLKRIWHTNANMKKVIDENDKLYTNNKQLWGII